MKSLWIGASDTWLQEVAIWLRKLRQPVHSYSQNMSLYATCYGGKVCAHRLVTTTLFIRIVRCILGPKKYSMNAIEPCSSDAQWHCEHAECTLIVTAADGSTYTSLSCPEI